MNYALAPAIKILLDRIQVLRDWRRLSPEVRAAYSRDKNRQLGADPGIEVCVAKAADWLCVAQRMSPDADGGVARHFSIMTGWGSSYPETTGYTVPTLIHFARQSSKPEYLESARTMLDWLVKIQLPDGSFQGGTIQDKPVVGVVFNTGQILMGLAAGSTEFGEPYTGAMHRAAQWLIDCIDSDGCWRQNQSPFALAGDKTYDTHTAWGLLEAARACNEQSYADAALRNIRWAIGKQADNGWYHDCCLTDPQHPLTHTLGYALRGIIEGYRYFGEDDLLASARKTGEELLSTVRSDGFIPGRLDKNWNGVVSWACLTGSVQIAHCWLLLYQDTNLRSFLDAARLVNRYARRTVELNGTENIRGAIRGSFPIHGQYGQYLYLNWAAKFFIDSNLLELSINQSES